MLFIFVIGQFLAAVGLFRRAFAVAVLDFFLRNVLFHTGCIVVTIVAGIAAFTDNTYGTLNAGFRIVGRLVDLAAVRIEYGLNACLEMADAKIRRQRLADAVIHIACNLLFQRGGHEGCAIGSFASRCQQTTVGVENSDGGSIKRRNGSGDQLADGLCGFGSKAAFGADDDRGGRLLIAATERAFFCHDYVNARGFHTTNGPDGSGDFAFKRTHAGDFLHKRGEAERTHIVEQLVTGIVRGRQALFSQIHAGIFSLADGHEDGRAVSLHVERNACFTERKAHAVHVVTRKADIERLVGWAAQIDARIEDRAHECRAHQSERDEFSRAELAERTLELFDQLLEILLHPHHRHNDGCKLAREACAKVAADEASAF